MNRRFTSSLFVAGMFALGSCRHQSAASRPPLPFGSVDIPAPKAVLQGPVQVAGWALSEQPIEEVAIYVDRKYIGDASLKLARPDVAAAKPGYKGSANSGWVTTLDTTSLAPGWHELVVQAKSQGGATRDLSTVPVFVQR